MIFVFDISEVIVSLSVFAGNIGNAFSIDETLGTIQVAKELDINSMHYEYVLRVKATDMGKPPLSSLPLAVHIMVVMADNAPPRYYNCNIVAILNIIESDVNR